MKRISIYVPDLVIGGAQRSMLKLAAGITARDYSVDLVLARAEGPFMAEVPGSVRVVDLGARRVLTSLPRLVRYLRMERPAALLSVLHGNVVSLWARRLSGAPTRVVVSERNTLSREVQHYSGDMKMRLMPWLIRRYYPWADGIVAVSKGVATDLSRVEKIPEERIRVIYNPIITPEFREKVRAPLEHPWFQPGEPPVILAVGRLTLQKDFSTLIKAFARVRQAWSVRLLILGEGEERAELEGLAREFGLQPDIGLPGYVPNPYPYMVRSSLFVLSSRWEGLPGVLIEALYCGVPLIAADCPSGPREILADGQYGVLFPPGDPEALSTAIEAGLNRKRQPPPRESWRSFELEEVVNQYLHVLLGY